MAAAVIVAVLGGVVYVGGVCRKGDVGVQVKKKLLRILLNKCVNRHIRLYSEKTITISCSGT